jgi:regulator of protease activity HflC (stomatin/prohibitin superfamily)
MKKLFLLGMLVMLAACQRIETGEVGLRVGFDKQVNMTELQPGSFNQVLVGEVLLFPVREVRVDIDNKQPITRENTALQDFDVSVIYNINPSSVAELYTTRARTFHEVDKHGEIWLMSAYMGTLLNNAAYKVVRTREALSVADSRKQLEEDIKKEIEDELKKEGLDKYIRVTQALVRNIQPNIAIVQSATEVVTAQNALKAKTIEVETAKKEAERIAALNSNAKAIEYMNAQATVLIAEAVKAGKVNTIVIPMDFKGFVNLK